MSARRATSRCRCRLTIWHQGEVICEAVTDDDVLIGTGVGCQVRLPSCLGGAPRHVLLAFAEGAWHLHSFSRWRLHRPGEPACHSLALADGDVVGLGHLEVACRLCREPRPGSEDTAPTTGNTSPTRGDGSLPREGPDAIFERARRLCARLTSHAQDLGPLEPAPGRAIAALVRHLTWPSDPREALDRFEGELARAPHDAALLRRLARYLERLGYHDLVLIILHHIDDLGLAGFDDYGALARLYDLRAKSGDRPISACFEDCARVIAYASRALRVWPRDSELDRLRHAALVRKTILRGESDAFLCR